MDDWMDGLVNSKGKFWKEKDIPDVTLSDNIFEIIYSMIRETRA